MTSRLEVAVDNRLDEIERLSHLVEEFGRAHALSDDVIHALNLALDELITNVIVHGYEDAQPHPISVRLWRDDDTVGVEMEDDGRAFNPLEVPPPDLDAPIEERKVGGLGLFLVRAMMDQVEYRREQDRNIVTLRKRVSA